MCCDTCKVDEMMEISNWIAVLSIVVTGTVAVIGLLFSNKRHKNQMKTLRLASKEQLENERKAREAEFKREIERSERHREDVPQFEFNLDVGLIKKKGENTLVEFLVVLNNKGNVKQDIKSVKLRIRAIDRECELCLWKGRGHRLEFPHKLFETEIIPKGYKFIFVEPHVRQILNYTTMIPGNMEILSARAEFSYGHARKGSRGSKHSVEKVFAVQG